MVKFKFSFYDTLFYAFSFFIFMTMMEQPEATWSNLTHFANPSLKIKNLPTLTENQI